MTEREQLQRAIVANPDDDTPRLVFADWLDEQDSKQDADRALWIRGTRDAPRDDLNLWSSLAMFHGETFGMTATAGYCIIRCGFIEQIQVTLADFVKIARPLFERHPVRSVVLTDRVPDHPGYRPRTWRWLIRRDSQMPSNRVTAWLPSEFRRLLKAHRNKRNTVFHGMRAFHYGSDIEARDDLNRACILYGCWRARLVRQSEATPCV